MAHLRFDRKELFTKVETKQILNIIDKFEDLELDAINLLYALFDGYYYTNLIDVVADSEIANDQETFDFLLNLANKIQYARFSEITLD